MLLREHRGRHEHSHLTTVLNRLEGRAQGHLGLAETDVADEQAVHRPRRLHIGLDVVNRLDLIWRLLVREAALQLELPRGVDGILVALHGRAGAVQLHQLAGQVAHRSAHLGLGANPLAAAQARQRRLGVSGPDISPDPVRLGDRDVEVVAFGIVQQQELGVAGQLEGRFLARRGSDWGANQPAIARDTVVNVHHQVAQLQIGDEGFARRGCALCRQPTGGRRSALLGPAEDLAVRIQRQTKRVGDPALAQQAMDQFHPAGRLRERFSRGRDDALFAEQLAKAARLLTHDDRRRAPSPSGRGLGLPRGAQRSAG